MTSAVSPKRLLIADDDSEFRQILSVEFTARGYDVATVDSLRSYRELESKNFDCAAVNLQLGRHSGLQILEELIAATATCRVVIMTRYGSIATAVRAMKLGAHDYLIKPTGSAAIERALLRDHREVSGMAPLLLDEDLPSLGRHEREYIEHVLAQCDGNISEAARRLGLHRQSLQRKLRKYPPLK
jgi:two-component system response regulator RegA